MVARPHGENADHSLGPLLPPQQRPSAAQQKASSEKAGGSGDEPLRWVGTPPSAKNEASRDVLLRNAIAARSHKIPHILGASTCFSVCDLRV